MSDETPYDNTIWLLDQRLSELETIVNEQTVIVVKQQVYIKKLEGALRPFGHVYPERFSSLPNDAVLWSVTDDDGEEAMITLGDIRRAVALCRNFVEAE
jgi:hypothetical protein